MFAAKNYIRALELILNDQNVTSRDFVEILCTGMRQSTSNILKRSYLC